MSDRDDVALDEINALEEGALEFEEINSEPYGSIQERKVLIQPYDYAVRTLMDMIIDEDLILNPNYQRKYQWDDDKASRFIESIALNIPVPVIYLAEESDGSFSVIDGQQRLTSLFRYMKPEELENVLPDVKLDELEIKNLKLMPELIGKKYSSLDRATKSSISKRPIRCIVVLNESDDTLKFEVFERLNTGSIELSKQEVRNCVFGGNFNDLLKDLASYHKFEELLSLPKREMKTMKDAELVLRFFAYRELDKDSSYSGSYIEYLNSFMEDNRNISSSRKSEMADIFYKTVDVIYDSLGPGVAFRKPLNQMDPASDKFAHTYINGAIYESQMVAFSYAVEAGVEKKLLKDRALKAFSNQDYWNCLFQGTSQKAKAIKRSEILKNNLLGN